jgi:uncharacterized repeat protein (TIGR03803 family)
LKNLATVRYRDNFGAWAVLEGGMMATRNAAFAAVVGAGMVMLSAQAFAAEKMLYGFAGGDDGLSPYGGLAADAHGNLYGTTSFGGGSRHCANGGCGTVFKLTPKGKKTVLHVFKGGKDGSGPLGDLLLDGQGNLYGTSSGADDAGDHGTVFKISPGGKETVLHVFNIDDGDSPRGGLVADAAGNLYGTTFQGGSECTFVGCGSVFKLAPDGTLTTLHSFTGGNDGAFPSETLMADAKGNFYGTAYGGGSNACGDGCGTIFKVTPKGKFTLLHEFDGSSEGAHPESNLVADAEGNLYGTTAYGGDAFCASGGCGTVFELAAGGTLTVLHTFAGGSDGANPAGELVRNASGSLYGATTEGGSGGACQAGCGTVFKLTPEGATSVVYTFTGGSDGALPYGGMILDGKGNLFGTTLGGGGSCNCGTVFKVKS